MEFDQPVQLRSVAFVAAEASCPVMRAAQIDHHQLSQTASMASFHRSPTRFLERMKKGRGGNVLPSLTSRSMLIFCIPLESPSIEIEGTIKSGFVVVVATPVGIEAVDCSPENLFQRNHRSSFTLSESIWTPIIAIVCDGTPRRMCRRHGRLHLTHLSDTLSLLNNVS